jgi:hypothetical protein
MVPAMRLALLARIPEILTIRDPVELCDVVFVLAGLPERKTYGLKLLHGGMTWKLVLSVARFEVRKFAATPQGRPAMIDRAQSLPPRQRHFFVEATANGATWRVAELEVLGTFAELWAFARSMPEARLRIGIVSTTIHMRRVRLCCRRIRRFRPHEIRYYPVPEACSSLRESEWWRSAFGRKYVVSELLKLAWYFVRFRPR